MAREKIVYLFGAGTTKGEMTRAGIDDKILMENLAERAYAISKGNQGEYSKFINSFAMEPGKQDIEWLISLFDSGRGTLPAFGNIATELRRLYRQSIIEKVSKAKINPIITMGLFHLYRDYSAYIGLNGENLLGILSLNNDNLTEKAYCQKETFGGLNPGVDCKSQTYKISTEMPPLLKLHGSFNWSIRKKALRKVYNLTIDDCYETQEDYSGWISPSVFKKPDTLPFFGNLWRKAKSMLIECDTLRIVGCSLRNEDFQLLSLIFSCQVALTQAGKKVFTIEPVMPEKSAVGSPSALIERLSFLSGVKRPSDSIFYDKEFDPDKDGNPYYYLIKQMVNHIQGKYDKIQNDEFIMDRVLGGNV